MPSFVDRMEVRTATPIGSHEVTIPTRQLWTDDFNEVAIFRLSGFDVLEDDSIPIDFPLTGFGIERSIEYSDETIAFRAQFHSYEYQIVPAPGAAIVIALGVMFRGGRRRRR